MPDFKEQAPKGSFGTFGATVTLVFLLPLCFLTIPALFFAKKAKRLYINGNYSLSASFREKARRCTISAWLVALIIASAMFALYFISRLSLI